MLASSIARKVEIFTHSAKSIAIPQASHAWPCMQAQLSLAV